MYLNDTDFKGAIRLISKNITLSHLPSTKEYMPDKHEIIIKFKYKKWDKNNYFTNKYEIDPDYLNKQPYHNVTNYWTNDKKSNHLKLNKVGCPRNRIAYYFSDTQKVKLYFPDRTDDGIKWWANTSNEDVFGYHRMGDYLFNREDRRIFILSSAKDEMVLNYFCNFNTIGLQSEVIKWLPEKLLRNLKWFDQIYIWLDADQAGFQGSLFLKRYLSKIFPTKEIIIVFHNEKYGNDIADISEKYRKHFKIIIDKTLKDL